MRGCVSFLSVFKYRWHIGIQAILTGQFTITADQFIGGDAAMAEQGDNACVEWLGIKCVGAEQLQ